MNVRMTRPLFGALGLRPTTMSAHAGRINPFNIANLVRRCNRNDEIQQCLSGARRQHTPAQQTRAVMWQHVPHPVLLLSHCVFRNSGMLHSLQRYVWRSGSERSVLRRLFGMVVWCENCYDMSTVSACSSVHSSASAQSHDEELNAWNPVTTTLASASRSFLLKKKWEEFRDHVASRWVFFWYRGDQQVGSSQTPTFGLVNYRFCGLCVHQALLSCPLHSFSLWSSWKTSIASTMTDTVVSSQ